MDRKLGRAGAVGEDVDDAAGEAAATGGVVAWGAGLGVAPDGALWARGLTACCGVPAAVGRAYGVWQTGHLACFRNVAPQLAQVTFRLGRIVDIPTNPRGGPSRFAVRASANPNAGCTTTLSG